MANIVTKTTTDVVNGEEVYCSYCTFDTVDSDLTVIAGDDDKTHYLLGFGYGFTQAHDLIVKSGSDIIWEASLDGATASKDSAGVGAIAWCDRGDALVLRLSNMTIASDVKITVLHTTSSEVAYNRSR